ncbi:DUF2651 family protein [Clostridium sp. ZS2-4]|uniref:DUF2651 family protein n=1 Tax=Clostridium sp. ZS2-4 TaxID=2987703 RepID=UPI003FA3DDF2
MQLVIVPFIVIGCGILVSIFVKKIFVAPIVTLILNILYERCFLGVYDVSISSWNVMFPMVSLMISSIAVLVFKTNKKPPIT